VIPSARKVKKSLVYMHLIVYFLTCVFGHSWLVQVGENGLKRGGLTASDLTNERYYCPFDDLSKCVAPNSNVVLTEISKRPCDAGKSPIEATAVIGGPLFLSWAGNGHVGKSPGTCVKVGITSYKNDPNLSDFQIIELCAPFNHGASTDTTVIIPSNLIPGEYTVFWVWDFADFYYSSCADINLVNASKTSPATPPTTKISVSVALLLDYQEIDCSSIDDPDGYCIQKFGIGGYCLTWSKDNCNRSHCQGHAVPDLCLSRTSLTSSTTLSVPLNNPGLLIDCKLYGNPDKICNSLIPGSYCKRWSHDECGRSFCFGSDPSLASPCKP
jgi:hypothetical protein